MPKWKNNKAALVYQDPTDLDNDNIQNESELEEDIIEENG